MNKKKLFFGIGTILLIAGAAFAEKINSKSNYATTLYFIGIGGHCSVLVHMSSNHIVTIPSAGQTCQMTFTTSGNCYEVGVFTTSGCQAKAYCPSL